MNKGILRRFAAMAALLLTFTTAMAQITSVSGTVSDDMGPLMGALVYEVDANDRIIESTVTDFNGNFTMRVRNSKENKLQIKYVGCKDITLPINKTVYNVTMQSDQVLDVVEIKAQRRMGGNNLPIPEREISYATQSLDMSEFEGLGITSVDEALQGRIAGLDIIANSGDLGSGSTMRLRGASTLSTLTSSQPLIVVDGNIRNGLDLSTIDLASANNEQFAQLLNINPEDIATITVLKDAAASAVYGSQGGNGVIEFTTKRGQRGAPRLSYSLKLTSTYQPDGYDLLSGDDYTMLLKEAYFNPEQDDQAGSIRELNYDPTFSEYEQYNNNTDWRDAVTQWGLRQNHYVSISGGGDKTSFRIGVGYDNETGTMIKQQLDRLSTRVALDYNVSERIRISTNFAMTYTKNQRNSDGLLDLALKKMPNMGIYEQYPVGHPLQGQSNGNYYTMLQTGSSVFQNDQRGYVNPVASAHLAKNHQKTYDMSPELILNYRLLGMEDGATQLNYSGNVYMNIYNQYDDKFYPAELVTTSWNSGSGVNTSSTGSSKSVNLSTKHSLTFIPAFENRDHSAMFLARFELRTNKSNSQSTGGKGLPSGGIATPDAGGMITSMSSSNGEGRSMFYTFSTHYAYKERYVADFTLRMDGTTVFGPGKRWNYFPSVSLRWNVIDEPWMEPTHKWLSMLSIRPSWGRVGIQPGGSFLYTSKYGTSDRYLDMSSMVPLNIRLSDMQSEIQTSYNLGMDMAFLDNRLRLTIEGYRQMRTKMLMGGYRIPANAGFSSLAYKNTGEMKNEGWEFHISSDRVVKAGKFHMDVNANFGNNRSTILEMDEFILEQRNPKFNYENREVLQRVQINNPFASIYGFRSKGVYQYNYETFRDMTPAEREQFLAEGKTAPFVKNANGEVVYDSEGKPVRMMYNYTNDGTGKNYKFMGGDAIYEDINHDGNINALDIVFLGNSLPKLTGGFGFSFTYDRWRLNTQFVYRVGYDILNMARLDAEAMTGNNNQSQAVNYRWRKEGDITTIPRAMHGNSNYNTLVSDRFVEDGSYLRMSYIQVNYDLPQRYLKGIGLKRLGFYASANNIFVLTKYSGVDPDISGGEGPAVDRSQTPRSRSFTLGVSVDF